MRAGRLRHRITIQRLRDGKNEIGEPVREWVDVATNVAAEVRGVSGREFIGAGAEQAEVSTQITMRFRRNVTAAMRVIHPPPTGFDEVYDIKSALPDGRRTQLVLMCETGVRDE